jgi:nucleotide-binding universal stress UspA family protein
MTTILAIIDGGREPAYRRSWPVALRLAEREGATLLLADRSAETWGETPHHSGPFSPEKYRAMGRHHLDAYLDEAADRGVPVLVWLPSLPLPESYYEETLSHNHVDLAVLPDHLDRPKLTERLLGSFAARVARAIAPGVPVLEVAGGGGLALLR